MVLKFADTIILGLIFGYDDLASSKEIEQLWSRCSENNLELNPLNTVEMTMDFQKNATPFTSNYGW